MTKSQRTTTTEVGCKRKPKSQGQSEQLNHFLPYNVPAMPDMLAELHFCSGHANSRGSVDQTDGGACTYMAEA